MTSQLNVDTIVDKAGSSGPSLPNTTTIKISNTSTNVSDGGAVTQDTVDSLVKARFRASDAAVLTGSFNFSSGTDNGTGDYTFTYTNGFSSVSYCAAASNQSTRNGQGLYVGNFATGSFRINPSNSSGSSTDYNTTTVLSGDLA